MREVAVVSAVRTAVGKAKKGSLKDSRPDDYLGVVLKAAVERGGREARAEIDDLVIGTAMPEAEQGMNVARIGGMVAGLPDEVPGAHHQPVLLLGPAVAGPGRELDHRRLAGHRAHGRRRVDDPDRHGRREAGAQPDPDEPSGPRPTPRWGSRPRTWPAGSTCRARTRTPSRPRRTRRRRRPSPRAGSRTRSCPFATKVWDGKRLEGDRPRHRRGRARRTRRSRAWPGCARRSRPGGSVTAGNSSQMSDGAAATLLDSP